MTETSSDEQQFTHEFVEQLQPDDTLIDRGVDDVLDEGYTAPDHWSPLEGFGNTPAEMRQGETIEMRESQMEQPVVKPAGPWNADGEDREVGGARAGRLVDARDGSGEPFGSDVGIDGGAASAEEAAVHVIDPVDDDDE